jgi:tRNA nucleotidyltransferase (CCA-adding enzyme)
VFLDNINAPSVYYAKILPLVREHMSHSPGGEEGTVSDSAVRRLVRRLDHAGGGPTLREWTRLVEADKGGRGLGPDGGAKVAQWLSAAERLDAENPRTATLLKGHHLATSGVPRGPLWAQIVKLSQDAQDNGAFDDEAGATKWLEANRSSVVDEAQRRVLESQAARDQKQSEILDRVREQQAREKAAKRARHEALMAQRRQ